MPVFVKICGLTSAADVVAVAAHGPDALGFVFWPGSPRAVNPVEVRPWLEGIPSHILRVGVFVDASADEVRGARDAAGLDVVQLHGSEPPDRAGAVGGRVWRALPVGPAMNLAAWRSAGVEAFVFDAAGGPMPGGTGRRCDWTAAAEGVARAERPVLLAGGLHAENVGEALDQVRPWGVDVSSGVESSPGCKDPDRVRRFMEQCRAR